jgi:hypothetical protein
MDSKRTSSIARQGWFRAIALKLFQRLFAGRINSNAASRIGLSAMNMLKPAMGGVTLTMENFG